MKKTCTPDITPFCDRFAGREYRGQRYDLTKPFVLDGWRYATNAVVCVRVPDKRRNSRGRLPKVGALFEGVDFSACHRAMPESTGKPCNCIFHESNERGLLRQLVVWGRKFCWIPVAKIRALRGVEIGRPVRTCGVLVLPFVADGGLQGLLVEAAEAVR